MKEPEGQRVRSVEVRGADRTYEELDPQAALTVVTTGAWAAATWPSAERISLDRGLRAAFLEYASSTRTLDRGGSTGVAYLPERYDSTIVSTTRPGPQDASSPYRGIRVTFGMYPTEEAAPGDEVMILVYDLGQSCYGWTPWVQDTDGDYRDNSVTNVEAYREMICFLQFGESLDCTSANPESEGTKKELLRDGVVPDTGLWSRVLAGTDELPSAPPGFECEVDSQVFPPMGRPPE